MIILLKKIKKLNKIAEHNKAQNKLLNSIN